MRAIDGNDLCPAVAIEVAIGTIDAGRRRDHAISFRDATIAESKASRRHRMRRRSGSWTGTCNQPNDE